MEVQAVDEYLDLAPLETRIHVHRHFSEHEDDVEGTVLSAAPLSPDQHVLNVGCGTGSFLARLLAAGHTGRLVGVDSSPPAIAATAAVDNQIETALTDAAGLGFPDNSFDRVYARHMLYHVSDVQATISELARVARPAGRVVVTVNDMNVTPNIAEIVHKAVADHGIRVPTLAISRVHSGNCEALLSQTFPQVHSTYHGNALIFDRPDPAIRFALSLLGLYGVDAHNPARNSVAKSIAIAIKDRFERMEQPWRDPKGYTVLVARP